MKDGETEYMPHVRDDMPVVVMLSFVGKYRISTCWTNGMSPFRTFETMVFDGGNAIFNSSRFGDEVESLTQYNDTLKGACYSHAYAVAKCKDKQKNDISMMEKEYGPRRIL